MSDAQYELDQYKLKEKIFNLDVEYRIKLEEELNSNTLSLPASDSIIYIYICCSKFMSCMYEVCL
jgi:hypothetical protein